MKTSELIDYALDWAVGQPEDTRGFIVDGVDRDWMPSTNWAQGGPIIEREGISLYLDTNNIWQANIFQGNPCVFGVGIEGETALIAAMRCYVASKLGDEVDVPEELV